MHGLRVLPEAEDVAVTSELTEQIARPRRGLLTQRRLRNTAIADSDALSNAIAGKGGLAIADSDAASTALAGLGGTAVADADATSNAVAGDGGTAIAKSKATSTAVAA